MGIIILLLVVAVVAVLICLNYWIAEQFYEAACMKGYNNKKYLWIAFFFNIVGYLLVIALPNKSEACSNKDNVNELPEL